MKEAFMKKSVLAAIAVVFLIVRPLAAEEKKPAYRVIVAPTIPTYVSSDIHYHINYVSRDFFRELTRVDLAREIILNEAAFLDFLERIGVWNRNPSLKQIGWDGADYAIYFGAEQQGNSGNVGKNNKTGISEILIVSFAHGEDLRVPVLSEDQHHLIAKAILLRMAELITDKKQQGLFQRRINSYFIRLYHQKQKNINLGYNYVFFKSEETDGGTPMSANLGLTLPLSGSGQIRFSTDLSGTYYSDNNFQFSAGIGFAWQTPRDFFSSSWFVPEIFLHGGYIEKIKKEALREVYAGGPFIEPRLSLGLYLGANFQISAVGSVQVSYCPLLSQFSTVGFVGGRISIGY
jgi:hypothetical protein